MSQSPLEDDEVAHLHGWERFMVRFYVGAMALFAAVGALAWAYSDVVWLRRLLLVPVFALVVGATVIQRRARCPRCNGPLGFSSRLRLPDYCPSCRVAFPRPPV